MVSNAQWFFNLGITHSARSVLSRYVKSCNPDPIFMPIILSNPSNPPMFPPPPLESLIGTPLKPTTTGPGLGLGGKMQTMVFSLHIWVEVAMEPPKTHSCVGRKLAPRMVTSIPPCIGPLEGMRRWITGGGTLGRVDVDGMTMPGTVLPFVLLVWNMLPSVASGNRLEASKAEGPSILLLID